MEVKVNEAKVSVIEGDITKQATDAIVNAANSSLMGGGGVDGAIHRAGGPAILEECKKIVAQQARLSTGKAVITTAGNLTTKYVIHTVGPLWRGGSRNEAELLGSAYYECLRLASESKLSSISFPSISTGAYGYPLGEAANIAVSTVVSFLSKQTTSLKDVVFALFDSRTHQRYQIALQVHANNLEAQNSRGKSPGKGEFIS
jgi:O-acetyl-ADP-ribose deacetylase (regulator of RNase III)